jgi:bacteriorhodopsin
MESLYYIIAFIAFIVLALARPFMKEKTPEQRDKDNREARMNNITRHLYCLYPFVQAFSPS